MLDKIAQNILLKLKRKQAKKIFAGARQLCVQ